MLMKLILTIFLTIQAIGVPTLTYNQKAETFATTFTPGAVWACIDFKSHTQTIEQEGKQIPYEPRKCYGLDEATTLLTDDWSYINCTLTDINKGQVDCPAGDTWDVTTTVQYPKSDGTTNDVDSNTLTLKH